MAGPAGSDGSDGQGYNWVSGGWKAGLDLEPYDTIEHLGISYVVTQAHTSTALTEPPTTTYFDLLASRGASGVTPSDGVDGQGYTWVAGGWKTGLTLERYFTIEHEGSSYVVTQAHTSTALTEPPNSAYFDLIAAAGSSGAAGQSIIGPTGIQGIPGVGSTGSTGASGVPGSDGQGYTWRGLWHHTSVSYSAYDCVKHNRGSYVAKSDHTSTATNGPGDAPSIWDNLAEGGDDGADGSDGSDGQDGKDFTWEGSWSTSQSYTSRESVYEHEGATYIANANHTSSSRTEPPNSSYQDLMAASGADGSDGSDGADSTVAGPTGPTGPSGAASTVAGPAGSDGSDGSDGADGQGYNWIGAWSSNVSISAYDTYEHEGSSYVCTKAHTSSSSTEPPNSSYQDLIAQAGSDGSDGSDGADPTVAGPSGPTGPSGAASTVAGPAGSDGSDGEDGVGFTWRHSWSHDSVAYRINDVVSDDGESFVSTSDHTSTAT